MLNDEIDQEEPESIRIKRSDYPSLFQNADQASLSAQRCYTRFYLSHLLCLILVSAGAALAMIIPAVAVTWTYIVLAIIIVIGVILNWVSRGRRYDQVWFDCRAVAESTKTAAWRFMMKAVPFNDDSTARQSFIIQLQRIRKARSSNPENLAQNFDVDAQTISDFMKEIRQKSLNERRNLYFMSRLRDQKIWYSNKAKFNLRKENCWFWKVLILQLLAVAFAIIWAASRGIPVNVVPLLMTCAASASAWSQMKRYGELAQTYSLAAQELAEQETLASGIMQEVDFLELVEQVEGNISREHTMWCARRNVEINSADMRRQYG